MITPDFRRVVVAAAPKWERAWVRAGTRRS
ncbi:MAG: hypothetical protein QOF18_806 [Frankiaceae bacterium]|jgi:hypothetical protein|nr:hypothetical protein [Frankiaceae bacterium]